MTLADYPAVMGPPTPSVVLRPGLLLPGTERYHVPGASAALIEIEAGDRVTVRNLEGGQPCELVAFDAGGRADAAILGTRANSDASGLKALLEDGDDSLQKFRLGLARRKLDLGRASAVRFFDGATAAGTEQTFTVTRGGALVVAAPGGAMDVGGQDTATPLVVMVKRATIRPAGSSDLPDPLADPVLDLRVRSRTAEAYFVKAGDYIQIIDVDGRQCTDFQCFSARKLDKGRDLALDVTATRSLMGHAYPMPGLHAK